MDTFLKDLFQEDLTKTAQADLKSLYKSMPSSELEAVLGLGKVAVAGPSAPFCPTGESCKACDADTKAIPKKATPPEMPSPEKTAFLGVKRMDQGEFEKKFMFKMSPEKKKEFWDKHGKKKTAMPNLSGVADAARAGWSGAGKFLKGPGAATSFLSRPGMALKTLSDKAVSLPARVGRAARMVAPHAALAAGGLYAGNKMLGGQDKQAQAEFLHMAASAVDGAPDSVRQVAVKLAAEAMVRAKVRTKRPGVSKNAGYDHENG